MSGRPRRRWLTALAMILAATAAVAVILSEGGGGNGGGSRVVSTSTAAARVQRRNLVATDTESGTLSYADPQTVYAQLPGTITWLPAVGKVIRPGHALLRIDNSPVLLLSGQTPAYRDLKPSDASGPDIYELNRNLVALGYEPKWITVDDVWQPGTTAGLKELQQHLGEAQTGSLTLGQVVFLPGPQLTQSQSLTVGATTSGGSTEALSTSSTRLIVTVELSPSSQSEATIGEKVTVEMPNGTNANSRVTAVSPVAQSSDSGDGSASGGSGSSGGGGSNSTVPVTVTLDKPAKGGGLDQASVSVNFVQSKARHVLSVPVTALLATSGESFAVQEASAPHRLIPVATGLFAAGYVQIAGHGIHPGLRVADSQG
ncbi:MAG: peptidoglycan-binding protein [Solirubrobacteraceae bacterium]